MRTTARVGQPPTRRPYQSERPVRSLSLSFFFEHRRGNFVRSVSSLPNAKVCRGEVLMFATLDFIEGSVTSSIFVGHIARLSDHNAIWGSGVLRVLSLGVHCRARLVMFCVAYSGLFDGCLKKIDVIGLVRRVAEPLALDLCWHDQHKGPVLCEAKGGSGAACTAGV